MTTHLRRGWLLDSRHGSPLAWIERDFVGVRILGWQLDLRTDGHRRLFSERHHGCGWRAAVHWHRFGLCFRATRLRGVRAMSQFSPRRKPASVPQAFDVYAWGNDLLDALDAHFTDQASKIRKRRYHEPYLDFLYRIEGPADEANP